MSVDKVDRLDKPEGNTETSGSPPKQCRKWCFTLNNPDIDKVDELYNTLKQASTKLIFAYEKGASGTPHYQGFIEFTNGKTLGGCRKLIPGAHFEVTHGNIEQNVNYCSKAPIKGPWTHGVRLPPKSPITDLRPWQEELMKIYGTEPDTRSIHWFWDTLGGKGKTAISKHLCLKGETLLVSGKANDVKYAVSQWIDSGKPLKAVIFAIPRVREGYVDYAALEEVKDGIFFNNKYESGMCIYDPIHVFVFANFEPDFLKLSQDRWVMHDLN